MKPIRGRLAQLVERTLSMREVGGSKPPLSKIIQISILQQFKLKKFLKDTSTRGQLA